MVERGGEKRGARLASCRKFPSDMIISNAAIVAARDEKMAQMRRAITNCKPALQRPSGGLFDLGEFKLHRRRAAEDRDRDLDALRVLIDILNDA